MFLCWKNRTAAQNTMPTISPIAIVIPFSGVGGASVDASVVKNGKGKKVVIFKYKPKKGYRLRQGHRQPYTKVEIKKINA